MKIFSINVTWLLAAILSIMLACIVGVTLGFHLDGFSITVLFFLYLTCGWNVFAYFRSRSMWPRRFKELDSRGNEAYRRIAFWATLFFYFVSLGGVAIQSIK